MRRGRVEGYNNNICTVGTYEHENSTFMLYVMAPKLYYIIIIIWCVGG
jgi:hypothetical protein